MRGLQTIGTCLKEQVATANVAKQQLNNESHHSAAIFNLNFLTLCA
ncbi:hypothetical protein AOT82_2401 [Psychrobacter sp. AntiMn-1]|nr:hypothetical protein AOT82_2401 [Psychrobacter sp. AntiMn-1]